MTDDRTPAERMRDAQIENPALMEGPSDRFMDDRSGFAKWLRWQITTGRSDPVGAFARVAQRDPLWPGGDNLATLRRHMRTLGARQFVLDALNQAWIEYEHWERQRKRKPELAKKRKAEREARKRNRGRR